MAKSLSSDEVDRAIARSRSRRRFERRAVWVPGGSALFAYVMLFMAGMETALAGAVGAGGLSLVGVGLMHWERERGGADTK
jgi:hypothetical protein